MIYIFVMIITVLLILNLWQYFSQRRLLHHVHEIAKNISAIIKHQSAEKVLYRTNHEAVQLLLIQINRLLDHNQKVIADYIKAKDSLRKLIANMSHDLKTPLTVILGYTEKLNQQQYMSEEEKRQILLRLNHKVNGLIALLNQFFDLVKIESEDYEIPLSRIALNEICRQSVLECYDLLTTQAVRVELVIPEHPLYILGNEHALHRIFSNLIMNSIRYGSEGGVFGLTLREEGDSVAVDIWDRGKGIAEVHQDRVFERLYTLDDARNPQFQGSGLGLSISKRLTEAMKGSIQLTSKPFEKTVFTCTFKQVTY